MLCVLIMRDGVACRTEDDAVARTFLLIDLAMGLRDKSALACAVAWHEALHQRGLAGEHAVALDLNLANLLANERSGTPWRWEQPTLERETYYLKRAIARPEFGQVSKVLRCKCLNNLGNRMHVAGRFTEALEYWRRVLAIEPNFGMTLCNRARLFAEYAHAMDDPSDQAMLLWAAHKEASAALAPTAIYTDKRDELTRDSVKVLKEKIEFSIDVAGIAADDLLSGSINTQTKEEGDYRLWCLENCLFLNLANDIGLYSIAANDSLELPSHVVRVDSPHIFVSFFEQMKQEFVSARWFLYEGLTGKAPHFSDKDVFLLVTDPRPVLGLPIEKLKAAYRISYSLFDKIAVFLGRYLAVSVPKDELTFRSIWRVGENGPFRPEFDPTINWGLCALYSVAKEVFAKVEDRVDDPCAPTLAEIADHIARGYLRVSISEAQAIPPDDLAFTVARSQFERMALQVLKLARSALLYLSLAVGFEERQRKASQSDIPLEEIPSTPYLADTEKV